MLRVWMILTALSACCLIVASCADPGTTLSTIETAKAATVAAGLATQAATEAATEMSQALSTGQAVVHDDGKGTTVIETKTFWVIYTGGKRYVIMKGADQIYGNPDK